MSSWSQGASLLCPAVTLFRAKSGRNIWVGTMLPCRRWLTIGVRSPASNQCLLLDPTSTSSRDFVVAAGEEAYTLAVSRKRRNVKVEGEVGLFWPAKLCRGHICPENCRLCPAARSKSALGVNVYYKSLARLVLVGCSWAPPVATGTHFFSSVRSRSWAYCLRSKQINRISFFYIPMSLPCDDVEAKK